MPSPSAQDIWLGMLLLISAAGFAAAARWGHRLSEGRVVLYGVCFSVMFTALVVAVGIAILR